MSCVRLRFKKKLRDFLNLSIKKFILISFLSIILSRLLPHPPNFTSLIALSFYVPAILGIRFIPYLIISFVITDLIIGYHNTTHWTWGSVFCL